MPKARQTCTRCSMRRQKCDRKDPCTRCVQNNEASSCSRQWQDGYDPQLHRTYPKPKVVHLPKKNVASGPISEGVPQDDERSASFMQNVATTQGSFSPYPNSQTVTDTTTPQPLSGITFPDDVQQSAPNGFLRSQAGNEPTSSAFPNGPIKPSKYCPPNDQSCMDPYVGAEISASGNTHSHAGLFPSSIEQQHLQNLVPTSRQILQMVEYHEAFLLWYHGSLHGPTFRMEVNKALQASDGLQLKDLDLRWSALLFSIMAASITCTGDRVARSWGFHKAQKSHLSEQWYEASLSCLYLGDYTSKLKLCSIQAIQVLSMSAHAIGFSNKQSVICGAALRIAQNLGLQRLALDPDLDYFDTNDAGTSSFRKAILIRRETGRRIWTQMCIQDRFSIPSFDMYSINKQHFTTSRPRRIDDETMLAAGDRVPLGTDSLDLMYDVASLMAQFHDSVTSLADPAAKYEQVLKYDSKMRALETRFVPHLFSPEITEAVRPLWPRWARGVARIVQQHKIIMIHRSFLGKSFIDPRYTYSRWASIEASKIILREVEMAIKDVDRPAFWHDQAHMVGASITLCLDILHRTDAEPGIAEHRELVDRAVIILRRFDDSKLASRGIRLLSSLLEGTTKQQPSKHHARHDKAQPQEGDPSAWPLEDRQSIDAMWASRTSNTTDDGTRPTASQAVFTQQGPPRRRTPITPAWPMAGDTGALDAPIENTEHFDFMNVDGSFGSVNDDSMLPEMSWWTDRISDYFPSQSGIANPFLVEDLHTQAP